MEGGNNNFFLGFLLLFVISINFPLTAPTFTPHFVWSAVNKSLEEDRLSLVDSTNEKVGVKGCARVILYNYGSEHYIKGNHSGHGVILINTTDVNFATPEVVSTIKSRINQINQGTCVPCIVVISLVNLTTVQAERYYRFKLGSEMNQEQVDQEEAKIQDYKVNLSQQLLLLLQYKTPIQARHLIMVRLVEKNEELTKCHGKKYTKYPRRLVSIWEQVLFDHFREARVIQGAMESDEKENKMLMSGKESGIWVWMCEEIIRRLELLESCDRLQGESEKEKCHADNFNITSAKVSMDNRKQCRMYRARS